jgi:hypothetical protein
VATARPRGDVPSEYRATDRVGRVVRRSLEFACCLGLESLHPGVSAARSSVRSRSWVFPAPSLTFACHQVGLRGLSHRRCLGPCADPSAWPLSAWLSLRALSPRWVSPPLLGFVRFRPSTDLHSRCPLPEPEGSFGQDQPRSWSCSAFAVSHRLDGLLHLGVAGLLHPAAGLEVRRVSDSQRQPTRRCSAPCAPSPRRGSHPSKNSTRQ